MDIRTRKVTPADVNMEVGRLAGIKTISLLDLEYQKEDLEYVDPNDIEKSECVERRAYKNGKIMKKNKDSLWSIEIKALMAESWAKNYAEYNYFREIDTDKGICTPLRVILGYEDIGKLNVYLKYDMKTERMKIVQAEIITEQNSVSINDKK